MNAQTAFLIFLAVVLAAVVLSRLRPERNPADTAITMEISNRLAKEFAPAGGVQVDVKTFDGVVILGGHVREHGQRLKAVEISRAVPGVKDVDDRIMVRSGG
ncbi:MAG: BON domain-containing protein [Desulfovibrio sp.]|jgi:osmotically-inducible protein OsmY|nr:BON domain-containing protein [Desulfovibrio sp.]